MDGAGRLRILVSIVFPLLATGRRRDGAVRVHLGLERVLLRARPDPDPEKVTLPLTLSRFVGAEGQVQLGALAAARCSRPSRASSSSRSSSAASPPGCSPEPSRADDDPSRPGPPPRRDPHEAPSKTAAALAARPRPRPRRLRHLGRPRRRRRTATGPGHPAVPEPRLPGGDGRRRPRTSSTPGTRRTPTSRSSTSRAAGTPSRTSSSPSSRAAPHPTSSSTSPRDDAVRRAGLPRRPSDSVGRDEERRLRGHLGDRDRRRPDHRGADPAPELRRLRQPRPARGRRGRGPERRHLVVGRLPGRREGNHQAATPSDSAGVSATPPRP